MIKRYTLSVTPENNNPTNYSFDTELEVLNWLIDAGFTTYSKDANGVKLFLRDRDNTSAFYTYEEKEIEYFILRFVIGVERLKDFKKEDILGCVLSDDVQADVIVWVKLDRISDVENFNTKFYSNNQKIVEQHKGGYQISKIRGTEPHMIPMDYDEIREEFG